MDRLNEIKSTDKSWNYEFFSICTKITVSSLSLKIFPYFHRRILVDKIQKVFSPVGGLRICWVCPLQSDKTFLKKG